MAYTLGNKCAKNRCKWTVLGQLIIENVVTCFFGHSVETLGRYRLCTLLCSPGPWSLPRLGAHYDHSYLQDSVKLFCCIETNPQCQQVRPKPGDAIARCGACTDASRLW